MPAVLTVSMQAAAVTWKKLSERCWAKEPNAKFVEIRPRGREPKLFGVFSRFSYFSSLQSLDGQIVEVIPRQNNGGMVHPPFALWWCRGKQEEIINAYFHPTRGLCFNLGSLLCQLISSASPGQSWAAGVGR